MLQRVRNDLLLASAYRRDMTRVSNAAVISVTLERTRTSFGQNADPCTFFFKFFVSRGDMTRVSNAAWSTYMPVNWFSLATDAVVQLNRNIVCIYIYIYIYMYIYIYIYICRCYRGAPKLLVYAA
jgi:hypothetical protein